MTLIKRSNRIKFSYVPSNDLLHSFTISRRNQPSVASHCSQQACRELKIVSLKFRLKVFQVSAINSKSTGQGTFLPSIFSTITFDKIRNAAIKRSFTVWTGNGSKMEPSLHLWWEKLLFINHYISLITPVAAWKRSAFRHSRSHSPTP